MENLGRGGIIKSALLSYPVKESDGVTIERAFLSEARQRLSIELMLGEIIVD